MILITELTREEKTAVVNKFFSELADILSEKYGCDIKIWAIPKSKEDTKDEARGTESA